MTGRYRQEALDDLIRLFGEENVNNAGIAVLEYPGLWATHQYEVIAIKNHLTNGGKKQ